MKIDRQENHRLFGLISCNQQTQMKLEKNTAKTTTFPGGTVK